MNSITQDMKYRHSLLTYAQKYGVSRASRKYNKSRSYIYFWRARYDGSLQSLACQSRRPHSHPNQHTQEELKLIADMYRRNPRLGIVELWARMRKRGYTRTVFTPSPTLVGSFLPTKVGATPVPCVPFFGLLPETSSLFLLCPICLSNLHSKDEVSMRWKRTNTSVCTSTGNCTISCNMSPSTTAAPYPERFCTCCVGTLRTLKSGTGRSNCRTGNRKPRTAARLRFPRG